MKLNPGDRIAMVHQEDHDPIEPGSEGTVTRVVDLRFMTPVCTQVEVDWDSGRSLSVLLPQDAVRLLT